MVTIRGYRRTFYQSVYVSGLFLIAALILRLVINFMFLQSSTITRVNAESSSRGNRIDYPNSSFAQTSDITVTAYLPLVLGSYPRVYPYQVTSGPYNDIEPRFSPDGKTIIFISNRAGNSDVFSVSVNGGTPVNLTQTPAYQEDTPVFSPDGNTIFYASNNTANGDWGIFRMDKDGSNKLPFVDYKGPDEIQPWPLVDSVLFSSNRGGNWDIYRAYQDIDQGLIQLTNNPASDRFPVASSDGSTVVFRSERDGNSEIYLMGSTGENQRRFTNNPAYDSYAMMTPDMSGIVFDSDRSGVKNSYLFNIGGVSGVVLGSRSGWEEMNSSISNDGLWRVYASRPINGNSSIFIDRFTSPLMKVAQTGADNMQLNCDWRGAVLAYGWIKAWESTHLTQYWEWAKAYTDRCIPGYVGFQVNDAALGYVALVVYQNDSQSKYLTFAQNVADWLMYTNWRTSDGTISHRNDGDGVWCDTMFSVPPFLVKMSQVTGDNAYFDEAVNQTIKIANHLQDPTTGLYHHVWSAKLNQFIGPSYWDRGNGWVLYGDVAVLSVMTDTHPLRTTLLNIYKRQVDALISKQDSSGLWPNVVNHSDYYLETSGSALIGYAIKQGIASGWLDYNVYYSILENARKGVWRKVLADGTVTDVMAGTNYLSSDELYNQVPHDALQLFGQGVVLLLGSP